MTAGHRDEQQGEGQYCAAAEPIIARGDNWKLVEVRGGYAVHEGSGYVTVRPATYTEAHLATRLRANEQALAAEREHSAQVSVERDTQRARAEAAETALENERVDVARISAWKEQRDEARREVERLRGAMERHLCKYDMADWLACSFDHEPTEHCEACLASDAGEHAHKLREQRDRERAAKVALADAARAVEWGPDTHTDASECPWCLHAKRHGHAKQCALDAALRAATGEGE